MSRNCHPATDAVTFDWWGFAITLKSERLVLSLTHRGRPRAVERGQGCFRGWPCVSKKSPR